MIFFRFGNILFALLLILHLRKKVFSQFPVFVFYLFYVFAHDSLFSFAPLAGLNYDIPWFYTLCCLISDVDHIIKFFLALSLYRHVADRLSGYRHFLYSVLSVTVLVILVFFVLRFNPSASFLYNTTIYLCTWSHLLMAAVCTLILVLSRMSHLNTDVTYRFIVLGLLFNGLVQTLNSFYLGYFYSVLSGYWRFIVAGGFLVSLFLWSVAALGALRRSHIFAPPEGERVRIETETALVRHEALVDNSLRNLLSP